LHIFASAADTVKTESLKLVAEAWQQAWELYNKLGDTKKAKELEKLLAALYKKKYAQVKAANGQQSTVLEWFNDWLLFLKIGCFGFGGPMAVFSLLEAELVQRKRILTHDDFLEGAVLGDVLPGPVTMDIVTYTGYKLKKWSGAANSTLFFILPSFVLMVILAILYDMYRITPKVQNVFMCLGAAVVGLVVSVAIRLARTEMKDYRELCILIWAFASSLIFNLDIVVIVGLAGVVGIVLYHKDSEKEQL